MCDMRYWRAILTAAAAIAVTIPVAHHFASASDAPGRSGAPKAVPTVPTAVDPPAFTGIQIERMYAGRDEVTAPAVAGRVAHLTLDPELQTTTEQLFRKLGVPEGAVLVQDLRTGRLLVYASKTAKGPFKDMAVQAQAPSASVFKIITAAALVEQANLTHSTRQCYRGGAHSIRLSDLVEDKDKDKWCATLAEAMGRSLNTIFARLAVRHLTPAKLEGMAGAFGYGFPVRFDLPVEPSTVKIPDGDLEFARTAAGFWNSTLSPLQALNIASTVALRGTMIRPVLVASVTDAQGKTIYQAPDEPQIVRRPIKPETADQLRTMMETTVSMGTGYTAFHDPSGRAFLPNIKVAAKTGTLTRSSTKEFYTWFVGFAPSDKPEVAFSMLVVNGPKWRTKANVLSREVLRAYFASRKAPGVTKP